MLLLLASCASGPSPVDSPDDDDTAVDGAGGADAANVIARLDGEDPTRVRIFSAHFASTSDLADTVAPGADDNASGVAAVLEAARILPGARLRDSVWFVATDAEELGSRGSAHKAAWLAAWAGA